MSRNVYRGIDQKIILGVRYYAWKLKSNICFANEDIEDIEQELMLFVLSKLNLFKPQKSKIGTFVSSVLKNKIKNLIKEKMAQKNEFQYTVFSIDENDLHSPYEVTNFLRSIDVNTFIHNKLPSLLRQTCELLKYYTVDEVAEILGKSASTIYQRIEKLRILMNDFSNYETESFNTGFLIQKDNDNTRKEN